MNITDLICKVCDASRRLVPLEHIPSEVGLTSAEWVKIVRENFDEIEYAIRRGRLLAEYENRKALFECVTRFGNADVALFVLRRDFGW